MKFFDLLSTVCITTLIAVFILLLTLNISICAHDVHNDVSVQDFTLKGLGDEPGEDLGYRLRVGRDGYKVDFYDSGDDTRRFNGHSFRTRHEWYSVCENFGDGLISKADLKDLKNKISSLDKSPTQSETLNVVRDVCEYSNK